MHEIKESYFSLGLHSLTNMLYSFPFHHRHSWPLERYLDSGFRHRHRQCRLLDWDPSSTTTTIVLLSFFPACLLTMVCAAWTVVLYFLILCLPLPSSSRLYPQLDALLTPSYPFDRQGFWNLFFLLTSDPPQIAGVAGLTNPSHYMQGRRCQRLTASK